METIILIFAVILLQGSSLPQFIRNYKSKSTKDISIAFPLMIVAGYVLAFIIALLTHNMYFKILYGIGIVNFSLLVVQVLYYKHLK